MPIGSQHIETGLMLKNGQNLILERDAAGRWWLDASRKASRLAGRRVRVQGIRDGYDLLAVPTNSNRGRQKRTS